MTGLQFVGNLEYLMISVGLFMMAGMFLTTTGWWKSKVGQSIAAVFASFLLISCWGVLRLFGIIPRDGFAVELARVVLFGFLNIGIWGMLVGFVVIQYLRDTPSRNEEDSDNV